MNTNKINKQNKIIVLSFIAFLLVIGFVTAEYGLFSKLGIEPEDSEIVMLPECSDTELLVSEDGSWECISRADFCQDCGVGTGDGNGNGEDNGDDNGEESTCPEVIAVEFIQGGDGVANRPARVVYNIDAKEHGYVSDWENNQWHYFDEFGEWNDATLWSGGSDFIGAFTKIKCNNGNWEHYATEWRWDVHPYPFIRNPTDQGGFELIDQQPPY